ncbi:MAG: universal stress protein [Nitrospiraceae bacterium]|nr:universal stress protein [Nitrospiraceae bacterium]
MDGVPKIERILFATRLGEMAFNSLETLFVLKAAGLREIVLCHIIPREDVGFVPFGGYLRKEAERLRQEAGIKFEDWRQAISGAGIESRIVIEVGAPVQDVAGIALREQADLLVIGRGGRIGPLAGSHTLGILRRCRVPVLVHRYLARFEAEGEIAVKENRLVFEKPLLAADWSPASDRALSFLVSMAGAVEKAGVVHVIDEKALLGPDLENTRQQLLTRLRQRYCDTIERAGMKAEAHIAAGQPAREIIETARSIGAGMIIAGATGKEKPEGPALGSVSHRLCEISEFPVLLVPAIDAR